MKRYTFLFMIALIVEGSLSCFSQSYTGYKLVFSDEFNLSDGSVPNPDIWGTSDRTKGNGAYGRWITHSKDVAFIRDGHLVCRAIRNTTGKDTIPMFTGSIDTRDRFYFQYGRVEVRMRTNVHNGNFPAAWLMPQPPAERNPLSGEIDIFEAFDNDGYAHHTVHNKWTSVHRQIRNPNSMFIPKVDVTKWHVYAVEWDKNIIRFFVDGVLTGEYRKSKDKKILNQGQWPYDRFFYIILNQSTGNGSISHDVDMNYVYETEFDYIRVYQKKRSKSRFVFGKQE